MKKITLLLLAASVAISAMAQNPNTTDSVYFTTGLKIGDVTSSSAVIWTRLCDVAKPVPITHKRKAAPYRSPINFDNQMPVEQMDGDVKGGYGQVMIEIYSIRNQYLTSGWQNVSGLHDFTFKEKFDGLLPSLKYTVNISGRKSPGAPVSTIQGAFMTAPEDNQEARFLFTSSSCQYFWDYDDTERGFKIYDAMAKLEPAFHAHTGDYVYYDKGGPSAFTIDAARHKWGANNAWGAAYDFYRYTPVYMQKDDHDTLRDDASPSSRTMNEMTFKDAVEIWREQVPIVGKPYRTFRWGKDLQVWIVEGREYRDDNWIEDSPKKTILGTEQKEWLERTIKESNATFKVYVSGTPVVGPDRETKRDSHANPPFVHEGDWLRKLLSKNRMYVVNGDRHWQYVSKDPKTGLREFSQGPTSESHVQGWEVDDKRAEHEFLRVAAGFLSVEVMREKSVPTIYFRHHDVDGAVVNEYVERRKK